MQLQPEMQVAIADELLLRGHHFACLFISGLIIARIFFSEILLTGLLADETFYVIDVQEKNLGICKVS